MQLEVALASWIAVEDLIPLSIMDTLPSGLENFIPHSNIIKNLACTRTKTTALIKNVIGVYD